MLFRVHAMALWLQRTVLEWAVDHNIMSLVVMIETPIMNRSTRGVTTLMTQMRMLAAYEEALFNIHGCSIHIGETNNKTVKAVFTGDGNADKDAMVAQSYWAVSDLVYREHLADAQAISTVREDTVQLDTMKAHDSYLNGRYYNNNLQKGKKRALRA